MMNGRAQEQLAILKEIFGECRQYHDEFLFKCPICKHHKPKLSINIEENKYKCWICKEKKRNYGKNIFKLILRFGNEDQINKWKGIVPLIDIVQYDNLFKKEIVKENHKISLSLPNEFLLLCDPKNKERAQVPLNYLYQRKMSFDEIIFFRLGFAVAGELKKRIIFPSFDIDGSLNFFSGRTYDNHPIKYLNASVSKEKVIFNELNLNFESDLILSEGPFDIIKGGNAVPLLGSSFSNGSNLFKKIILHDSPVYIALDADAQDKECEIIEKLLSFDIEVHKMDLFPYKDLGEMSKEEILERKHNAVYVNQQNFMSLMIKSKLKRIK